VALVAAVDIPLVTLPADQEIPPQPVHLKVTTAVVEAGRLLIMVAAVVVALEP